MIKRLSFGTFIEDIDHCSTLLIYLKDMISTMKLVLVKDVERSRDTFFQNDQNMNIPVPSLYINLF